MKAFSAIIIFGFWVQVAFAQNMSPRNLVLVVRDSAGAVPIAAEVSATAVNGETLVCQKKELGEFVCEINFEGDFLLSVRAEGFSILRQTVPKTQDLNEKLLLTLFPLPLNEQVVVTANRTNTRIGDTPASVVSVSKEEIQTSAAPAIDDILRQVPGFSLFRRSGSRNANPTTQGVSLRGVGASGAGRSLVLFDDVPLNDPFGGWTQWSRIAPIAVERIEVLRGGASSLYGNNSLSGTVNIIPREVREKYAFSGRNLRRNAANFFSFDIFRFQI